MWKSPRVKDYQEGEADEAQQLELDSVEEARINALTQSARYLQGVRRYHDRNVQQRTFNRGDQCHHDHGCSSYHQGHLEAYRLHGSFKSVLV